MKIIYTIAGTYRPAGMERVLADKVNWLASRRDAVTGEPEYDILIVTTDQRGRRPAFEMDSRVRSVDIGVDYELNNGGSFLDKLLKYPQKQLKHRRSLKKLIAVEKPDIVVSMFCGDEGFLTRFKDGSRKVLEIHFSRYKRLQYGRRGLWAMADRLRSASDLRNASRFDRFAVLTEEDRVYWNADAAKAGVPLDNLVVIPNSAPFCCSQPAPLDEHLVVAVGRYSRQKNLDVLLQAWSVAVKETDWKLWLVGDGEERGMLEAKAEQLGIVGSVRFGRAGVAMPEVYQQASILAMSSLYEGLPMVLIEAQCAGVPAVSFACKCGPRDVITDGTDGLLVPEGDAKQFAEALRRLMDNDGLRRRMGAAAFAASARYDEDLIMGRWDSMFKELVK